MAHENLYDAVIIGGGPAGLTAALYLARAHYRVVVVEKDRFGGQIAISSEVVNYPGVKRADGETLTSVMREQALSFGAELLLTRANKLMLDADIKTVRTDCGDLRCFAVLLATGARPREVGFDGEEAFKGHGVAYCATCDGEFFSGMEVFVIGGGFAAAEESVFLTKYATHVTVLIREDDFTCAKATAQAARDHDKITVLTNVEVTAIEGDSVPRVLRYKDNKTGQIHEYRAPQGKTFGVFVFVGYEPATELAHGIAELDEHGYILTNAGKQTSVQGLYAAGDVCVKPLRQVTTAVGDGALAATEMERLCAAMQAATGLHPIVRQPQKEGGAPQEAHDAKSPQTPDMAGNESFDEQTRDQLMALFGKMANPLILHLTLDDLPVSRELREYMQALCRLTDKLTLEEAQAVSGDGEAPCVRICRANGQPSGLAFHGVPGGHEFTAFVLGLYAVAGPGQTLEPDVLARIRAIRSPVRLRVLISLSCTMCPELVTAAQRIAAENEHVTADVYDLAHYPALREQFNVMSVPCLIVGEDQVSFGRKNITQVLDLIDKHAT